MRGLLILMIAVLAIGLWSVSDAKTNVPGSFGDQQWEEGVGGEQVALCIRPFRAVVKAGKFAGKAVFVGGRAVIETPKRIHQRRAENGRAWFQGQCCNCG